MSNANKILRLFVAYIFGFTAPILFEILNVPPFTEIMGTVDCTPSINFKIESSGTKLPVKIIPEIFG